MSTPIAAPSGTAMTKRDGHVRRRHQDRLVHLRPAENIDERAQHVAERGAAAPD